MKQLVICKDSYAERNELRDDMKTLKEYGILGAQKPNGAGARSHYSTSSSRFDHDNPLLYNMEAD